MKKAILTILTIVTLGFILYWGNELYRFANGVKHDAARREQIDLAKKVKNGDIIFQTSKSNQSKAIQIATRSKYSHMGIIYKINGKCFVYEAVKTVRLTPLTEWINRGKNKHYVIKRLINADRVLTPETLKKMKVVGEKFKGKPYDRYFDWSDDKMYCSELVWKIYKESTGLGIGKLEKLSDFDLTNKIVKRKLRERYGKNTPMNEEVISPAAMLDSKKLKTVKEN